MHAVVFAVRAVRAAPGWAPQPPNPKAIQVLIFSWPPVLGANLLASHLAHTTLQRSGQTCRVRERPAVGPKGTRCHRATGFFPATPHPICCRKKKIHNCRHLLRCGAMSTHHDLLRCDICCIEESAPRCHNPRANDKHPRQMIRHGTTDKSATYDLQAALRIMHITIIVPLARFPPARSVPPSANARPSPSVLSPSFHGRSICVASLPVKRR